jgi:hypothetical protein
MPEVGGPVPLPGSVGDSRAHLPRRMAIELPVSRGERSAPGERDSLRHTSMAINVHRGFVA